MNLFYFILFLVVVVEYSPVKKKKKKKKKNRETALLRTAHDAKLPSFFFFRVIAPAPNKTNRIIPYHLLIISFYKTVHVL
jgi:hypothetical protein